MKMETARKKGPTPDPTAAKGQRLLPLPLFHAYYSPAVCTRTQLPTLFRGHQWYTPPLMGSNRA